MDDPHVETLVVADEDAGERLDKLIAARLSGLSRARVQALMRDGQVHLGGVIASDPGRRVKAGEAIAVAIPASISSKPALEALVRVGLVVRRDLAIDAHVRGANED